MHYNPHAPFGAAGQQQFMQAPPTLPPASLTSGGYTSSGASGYSPSWGVNPGMLADQSAIPHVPAGYAHQGYAHAAGGYTPQAGGYAPANFGQQPSMAGQQATVSLKHQKSAVSQQTTVSLKGDAKEKAHYACIKVTGNCMSQFFNDIVCFHRHFQRSQESDDLLANVASPDEKLFLRKELGVKQLVVVNIMVWRRSVMKVLLVFMTITTIVNTGGAHRQWKSAWATYSKEPMRYTYGDWVNSAPEGTTGFHHYSIAVAHEIERLMKGQADIVRAGGSCIIDGLGFVSLLLCQMASISWLKFRLSRSRLMAAWFLSVAAPFLVSMVPARLFVDWGEAADLIETYKTELDNQLGVEPKLKMLRDNCLKLETQGTDRLNDANQAFERVCGIVDRHVPNREISVPTSINIFKWFDSKKFDLTQAHKGCSQGRALIGDGKPLEALEKAKEACATAKAMLDQYANNYGETPEVMHYFAGQLQHVAEATISLSLALQTLSTLFPAALSIAPGLLKGALRMKMLVPQSIIPGMFVLVLPWLYCPLTWCMYSLGFQLIGNCFLLIGLVLVAFNPIAYFVIGQWYGLAKPMTDELVVHAIRKIKRALIITCLVAYGFIGYFVVHILWKYAHQQGYWGYLERWEIHGNVKKTRDWGERTESQILATIFRVEDWKAFAWSVSVTLSCIISSAIRSFYLTTAAGVDWMVNEMVEFRQVEISMESQAKEGDDIVHQYNARMDQLLALDRGVRASVFQKQKTDDGVQLATWRSQAFPSP